MRWLIVGPSFDDSFTENVAVTVRAMGHEARTMPQQAGSRLAKRVLAEGRHLIHRVAPNTPWPEERWAVSCSRTWPPDIVLAPTVQLTEEGLVSLRKAGAKAIVAWWGDPPANLSRLGLASRQWDLILFKDRDAVAKHRLLGLNAHLLHEAMNPIWHRPNAEPRGEEVAIAGNWYGFRQSLVSLLLERGVKVGMYGPSPPSWSLPEIRAGHRAHYVVKEEKSRVFGSAFACLNTFSHGEGNSLNCRAFEIAGAGGLQVIEFRSAIEACFEPGKEVLPFQSLEELLGHLDRARRSPAEATKIRLAGARRALAEHTYRHRLETILKLLGFRDR